MDCGRFMVGNEEEDELLRVNKCFCDSHFRKQSILGALLQRVPHDLMDNEGWGGERLFILKEFAVLVALLDEVHPGGIQDPMQQSTSTLAAVLSSP